MLISKEVEVKWNNYTKKWYESKGYVHTKSGDIFICRIEDLQIKSTVIVECECDYCGNRFQKEYKKYNEQRILVTKDCCSSRNCMVKKSQEVSVVKYGVINNMKLDSYKKLFRDINKMSYSDVNDYMSHKGLNIITTEKEYTNSKGIIKFICSKHKNKGVQESTLSNIRRNKHCCSFGGSEETANHLRNDTVLVYKELQNKGLIPMFQSDEYKSRDIKIPFVCKYHKDKGIQYKTYASILHSKGCAFCAIESAKNKLKLNEDNVFNLFLSKGLIVEEGETYINKDTKIKYRCKYHQDIVQTTTYNSLQKSNCSCELCRMEESVVDISVRFRSSIGK